MEDWIDMPPGMSNSDRMRIRLFCISFLIFVVIQSINFFGAFWAFGGIALQHAALLGVITSVIVIALLLRATKNPLVAAKTFTILAIIGIWISTYIDHAGQTETLAVGAAYTPYMIASLVLIALVGSRAIAFAFMLACLATLFIFYLYSASFYASPSIIEQSRFGLIVRCSSVILTASIIIPVSRVIYTTLESLEAALERTRAAELSKAEFLSTMSHEIRTPLGGIVSMADLLARGNLPETERKYAHLMQVGANSLMEIINEVLELSKLENGRVRIANEPLSPTRLLQDVADLFETKAAEKNLDVTVETLGLPDRIMGDGPHLRQILNNLMSNALKFTKTGGVRIGGRLVAVHGDTVVLQFFVKDSGSGIALEERDKLFKRFSQTSSSQTTEDIGSGLGLSISRELTEMMGGSLELESALGQGTVFHFTLGFDMIDAEMKDAA